MTSMLAAVILVSALAIPAQARTKLVALPSRDTMRLNLDHPTASLVTEERVLSLQKGNNMVDFSWQGVRIDPATIELQALDHPEEVKLINISYPPNENALVWNLYSPKAVQERVRIHYLLSGLQRTVSYREEVVLDETQALLRCRYRLANGSGEDLSQARVTAGFGEAWTTDLRDQEVREVLMFESTIPVEKQYIYHGSSGREQTPLYYLMRNTEEWGLGEFKLRGGKVRVFQDDPQGSVIFLGEDWMKDLAVKEKAELSMGVARDVVVKRNMKKDERRNIRRDQKKRIVVSDRVLGINYEIENFKDEAVTLKIVEAMYDNWSVEALKGNATVRWERKDNETLEIFIDLPPKGDKVKVDLTLLKRNQLK